MIQKMCENFIKFFQFSTLYQASFIALRVFYIRIYYGSPTMNSVLFCLSPYPFRRFQHVFFLLIAFSIRDVTIYDNIKIRQSFRLWVLPLIWHRRICQFCRCRRLPKRSSPASKCGNAF